MNLGILIIWAICLVLAIGIDQINVAITKKKSIMFPLNWKTVVFVPVMLIILIGMILLGVDDVSEHAPNSFE